MLDHVRRPFMDKLELSGLTHSQATRKWGHILSLIQQHPGSGIRKQVRTKWAETATEAVLDVSSAQHAAAPCFAKQVAAALSAAIMEYGTAVPCDTNCVIDGRVHFQRGLGRFTNQCKDSTGASAAMRWVELPSSRHDAFPRGYISLYAKRDIKEGEESFMKYGAGHVFNNC